jgi:SAM-dependent methyltransferase
MTNRPKTRFAGTAAAYARHRPPYPPALFARLREQFALDGTGRLLDLGCGPGTLALPLAPDVAEVVGIDPEPEMLAEAARLAADRGVTNTRWVPGGSDDLPRLRPALGTFRLATMGRAFHWMDREATLRVLCDMLVPGGGVAIVGDGGTGAPREAWHDAVDAVVERWVGEVRTGRPAPGAQPPERHEAIVARSPFPRMATFTIDVGRAWDIDGIVGHLASTSFALPLALGDRQAPFERELRAALRAIEPSGRFTETARVEAILAWKA